MKRLPKVAVCRNARKRVLVALPFSHLSQRKLAGIFRYVCECADWDLNIMSDGSLLTPEAFDIIANEGVDGVIVSADGVERALAEIAKRNIPVALIGLTYFPRATDVVFVHTDESSIGREAALFFLKRAHWRSYGYVHAQNLRGGWDARRARAFSATLSRHSVKCHEFPEAVQSDRSSKALETWLRVLPKPAAVFASDDYRAYEVISACKAVGIRVPADVAVIGVGNTEVLCENAVPSISSIEPDYYNEGYLAAKYLDRIMSAGGAIKAERVSGGVKGVIARNSTSKPKESSGLLVQKALAYIRANVCRRIDVQDVVAHLHVSRTLADLRFREVLGTTILNTIVDERLERTRRKLMNSDESIACVCSRCGWKSENHPKKLFRAKYGQSMRAFRNSSRLCTIGVAALVSLGALSAMAEVNTEDEAFRPTLSESGYATSPACKEAGKVDLVNCRKDAPKRLADAPKMKPVLTVPHELDCLIESGHIQGACCSEQGVYLSHARGLEKIGWDGKLIKHVDAPSHLGDCAYADGKIYGAFVIRDKKTRKDRKRGLVRVWDENLNVLKEAWFDEALDGIVVLGDTVYVGVDRWGKKLHPLCCVKRLDLNLNDLGNTDVDLGYDIAYGVQTMATDGKDLFFGSYGGTSRVSADLKENARIKFRCSEGFGLVPKSVAKSDAKVFFVVHAMGGNMQGWRKDPENNPPRIRLDFFEFKDGNEFKDGKFVDISVAEEAETFTFTKAPGNDGGKYCRFQVPFNADLSACDGFEFDYRISDLQSSGRLVVFAGTSSNESYSMRVDVPTENEWTHVVLRKRDVYDKSTTNGWAKIVRITLRYSVRGEKGFTAQLRNLRPLPTPDPAMAILFAENAPRGEAGTKSRRKFSFAADRLGLGSFYLSDHDLARGIPPNMKMLFLGRQKPIPEAAAMIEKFRAAGGKVVTWRKLPPTLDADLERLARENMPGAEAAIARRKAELEVIAQAERQAIAKIPNTGRPGERRKISCHVPTGHGSLTNWEENVKLIKACGFNTLSVNLCRGIYAAYKSKVYKPWPGKSGTDMLEVIKAACNRHGIKFVAWRCCWATPDWLTTKEDLEARRAAGRMVVLKNGELLTKGGCPTHPENIRQEVEGLIELAHKGVSGVNLDFIRYPGEGGCFCARCRSLFEKRIGRTVAKWPDDLDSDAELNSQWIDFRADNITYVVKTVGEYIHKNTPGVMVSVSGFDNPVIARTSVGQDWPYWCRHGWVDVAGMMDYRDTLAEYKNLISGQCSIDVGKAKRSTSIGPSCWGNVEQPALLLAQMIQAAREAGFDGWSVFDFDERTAKLLPLLATGPTKPVHGGENAHE